MVPSTTDVSLRSVSANTASSGLLCAGGLGMVNSSQATKPKHASAERAIDAIFFMSDAIF